MSVPNIVIQHLVCADCGKALALRRVPGGKEIAVEPCIYCQGRVYARGRRRGHRGALRFHRN